LSQSYQASQRDSAELQDLLGRSRRSVWTFANGDRTCYHFATSPSRRRRIQEHLRIVQVADFRCWWVFLGALGWLLRQFVISRPAVRIRPSAPVKSIGYSELRNTQIANRGQLGDDFAKCQAPLKSGWLFHAVSRRFVLGNNHILRNEPNLALPSRTPWHLSRVINLNTLQPRREIAARPGAQL